MIYRCFVCTAIQSRCQYENKNTCSLQKRHFFLLFKYSNDVLEVRSSLHHVLEDLVYSSLEYCTAGAAAAPLGIPYTSLSRRQFRGLPAAVSYEENVTAHQIEQLALSVRFVSLLSTLAVLHTTVLLYFTGMI